MLSSSSEYLMALREGDFLCFLDWPAFVAQKYGGKNHPLSGDGLLDCLVFEWLSYGYREQDMEQMSIIYAVYERSPSSLWHIGRLVYQLMTLTSALLSCAAFYQFNLYDANFPNKLVDEGAVLHFMNEKTQNIGKEMFNEQINFIRDDFLKRTAQLDNAQVVQAYNKIAQIPWRLLIVEKYENALNLRQVSEPLNTQGHTRLAIARSLLAYLQTQTELTDEVGKKINNYVRLIRNQQPADWEENYLEQISPISLIEKSWKAFVYLSSGFFTLMMPKTNTISQLEQEREVEPNNSNNRSSK